MHIINLLMTLGRRLRLRLRLLVEDKHRDKHRPRDKLGRWEVAQYPLPRRRKAGFQGWCSLARLLRDKLLYDKRRGGLRLRLRYPVLRRIRFEVVVVARPQR